MVTGSLQKQNGKYYAVLNLYVEGKRKQKWIDTGLQVKGNKRKAEAVLDQLKLEYSQPTALADKARADSPLFSDFLQDWLQITKSTIDRSTYRSYQSMIDARIDKHFRDLKIRLHEVEPKHIRPLYDQIMREGYTTNTVIHYHAVIRKALEYAVKNELIDRNPADRVDRPKKNKYIADYYSKEEMMTLFEAALDDPLATVIQLAAYYGLRRSEVLGLRWSAINFEKKTLSINHKVTEDKVGGKTVIYTEDKLKTKTSYRTLPLIPAIEEVLLQAKERQQTFRKLHKTAYCQDYLDYVCVDPLGKLFRPNYVTEHFTWLLNKYQLRKIRFHDLRHSCASLLLAQGIPMKAIQEWLGHSTFSTTADIYSHLDFNSKLGSAYAISAAFKSGKEKEMPATVEEEPEQAGPSLGM